MKKIDQKINKISGRGQSRKPYVPPSLREFGTVGALTQSGTAAMAEFSLMWNGMTYFCSRREDRQMC